MNFKLRYSIIIIDLSLKNPKIQELCPLITTTTHQVHFWANADISRVNLQSCRVVRHWVLQVTVEEQTRKNSNFPVHGIFKNPREIIVNIFR